jgi:D-mannonate dehydratase
MLPKQKPKQRNINDPNIIIPYIESSPPMSWMSSISKANQRITDNCIRTIINLAKTIETIKSFGFMGVTKSLLRIPLLLYSTKLNPLPAMLRFMSINANNPGTKKSMYR